MKVLIIDFADSFTYNIFNEFLGFTEHVTLISYLEIESVDILSYEVVVLGPGPGIVSEYSWFNKFTHKLIIAAQNSHIHLLGICLGHQLIHHSIGRELVQLNFPIHGQKKSISFMDHEILNFELRNKSFFVQHYNSWAILKNSDGDIFSYEVTDEQGFLQASFSKNITTYQFHPESVGTSCPKAFFKQSLV